MTSAVDIDDSLYSRQRYVLGDNAMQRLAKSSILLYGVGGLGIEIAKNIVLAGIKSLTIQDPSICRRHDLGTQFFLQEEDVDKNKNRAEISILRLAELNPYVNICALSSTLDSMTDLLYMKQFQCVILTELPLATQLHVNAFCRTNDIKFISADVYGLFAGVFCDFGDSFQIADPNGEEAKDAFVADISKANPGLVTVMDNKMHGFETDDMVTFREVKGMTVLNGMQLKIKVLSPYTFSICDTTGDLFAPFTVSGIVTQVKTGKTLAFESLEMQLKKPDIVIPDYSKFEVPSSIHAGFIGLNKFNEGHHRLPDVWCKEDADRLVSIVNDLKCNGMLAESIQPCEEVIRLLSYTCRGCFLPLCAALGGIAAQEGLKAITGKFTPLKQWLYLCASDILTKEDAKHPELFQVKGDRYDQLRICIGENVLQNLQNIKLFMIGCGAIGCEMLKNYAMMAVGTGENGQIIITDNDLIEKSNLNRQFLFRPQHIRQPKSTTAAQAALQINPAMKIIPQQHKVCVQTEKTVYPDSFFEAQDIIVNALDNVEARRYVDSRCVTAQRSLLESGTLGTKGHTQVIVAHLTESYGSQRDPVDEDVPYCTLKSFPANIEHCIQWARDKFESSFVQKPSMFNKFFSANPEPDLVIQKLSHSEPIEGAVKCSKVIKSRPADWSSCIRIGRLKFEKYFNHKAQHLLNAFPLDTTLSDGSPFWQSPKRPPTPLVFDPQNQLHLQFVIATAHLYADTNRIPIPHPIDELEIKHVLSCVKVPLYVPSNKKIEVEESASNSNEKTLTSDDLQIAAFDIQAAFNDKERPNAKANMAPAAFEKDDDTNGHIDFISTAANLRACMYELENADRLHVKKIAGRIVPAIATTTAAVAGLITIELVKVIKALPLDKYRNCFINLALPVLVLSEPGPAEKTVIRDGLSYTNWDRWEVQGHPNYTLQDLLITLQNKVGFETTLVCHGNKIVYTAFMPQHKKRLPDTLSKLLKQSPGDKYRDLIVGFEAKSEDDVGGPPVRYFFGQ